MDKIIEDFIRPVLNKKIWQARQSIGSSLKFEIGKKLEDRKGQYHFWIFCCHWWLQQGSDKNFVDIVNSESNRENIRTKITILNEKKLLQIEYDKDLAGTTFCLEDDIYMKLAPYSISDSIEGEWYLFTPEKTLRVGSDGPLFIEEN